MSYKPFGSKWAREMNKLTKAELIDMLQRKLPELSRYKKALEKAQEKLRSTQENWREQCLFEADEIMTEALKEK